MPKTRRASKISSEVTSWLYLTCLTLCVGNAGSSSTTGNDLRLHLGLAGKEYGVWLAMSTRGKFGLGVQNEAGQRPIEFFQESSLSQQTSSSNNTREDSTHGHLHIYTWWILKSDWLYYLQSNTETLYTISKNWWGADCGSDHELLIAKFRLQLKKVGKATRPFRYDLSQIPYDYTVEVGNRFKGLDLMDRVP